MFVEYAICEGDWRLECRTILTLHGRLSSRV